MHRRWMTTALELVCSIHRTATLPSLFQNALWNYKNLEASFVNYKITNFKVLVKCDDSSFARQVLIAFAYLLPIGCVHLTYSQRYEHVFKFVYQFFFSKLRVAFLTIRVSDC
uniref:BTB domain-containing protein n=1 Tax=Ascaris lumbricoides TaxID=6252 RepID=A0A0M3INN5_ASCLU